MAIFWINLVIVSLSSFMARFFSRPFPQESPYVKPNKIMIFVTIASLVLISGLRNNVGDTWTYMYSYKITDYSLSKNIFKGDFGFNFLQGVLQKFSKDPQILIFSVALVTNLLIVLVLYKYSRMVELSLFVYIASGMYTVSMNGIRQYLAAAIIFASTKFILNGNWKSFILIVLIASTIHQTGLIFIPIYFIVRQKAWTKVSFILLGVSILVALAFGQLSSFLFDALDNTKYGGYAAISEQGANLLRVAVSSVPLIIAFFGKEKLRELWPKSDIIVNLSLIGFVFMVISTRNWIFARFDIYFGLYNLILTSWIVKLFSKRDRKVIYFLLIGCYLYYFYYEQVISLGMFYSSKYIN
jgi:transmembrane protein EpsG